MDFVAIDVETANSGLGSICQLGVARFAGGHLAEEWSTLLDPEDYFDDFNVSIHGIAPEMVEGKPTLPQVADRVSAMLQGTTAVSHTHFDRVALGRAYYKYDLPLFSTSWLDSARVARRTWKEMSWGGYGLAACCKRIGYDFEHHDALEDAKAAGHVLLAAIEESKLDLDGWKERVAKPIDPTRMGSGAAIRRDGNPEGDLYGEVIVFTGTLTMPRVEAADIAAQTGCRVDQGVTKQTTLLVVGDQDAIRLRGKEKSSKHRKAEQLVAAGARIRILRESDFLELVRQFTEA